MMQWRGPALCRPPGLSRTDGAMLMDVGHRLLGSLRHVDSRCCTFLCNSPHALFLTAHFNTHREDVGTSSRYCWHGRQRVVPDENLMKLLGAILKVGAALKSWRSWVLGSELIAGQCSSHRLMVCANTEAWDIQGVSKNDEVTLAQTDGDKTSLLDMQKYEEPNLLGKPNNQIENFSFSTVNALTHTNHDVGKDCSTPKSDAVDVAPSGCNDGLSEKPELLANLAIIVFDIETTGFKLSDDRIVEFAARDVAGGECSTIQTLVNPERLVPSHASNIHGISSDMVNKSDIPKWNEVAPIIIQYVESRRISGGPIFLVAHNGKRFDVPFLMKEFERCSLQIPPWWQFIDSVPIAREAMKAKGGKGLSLRLSALYEYYSLPFVGQAHRALTDVHMLACVLQMLMADLKMPVSEFLKKSFTTKDILGSSASSSDNSESLSQDLDISNEFSMEAEELDGSSAPLEANEDSLIPWDDIQVEQPCGNLSKFDTQERACSSDELEAKSETQTTSVNETISKNISLNPGLACDCNIYRTLKSDNIDMAQLSPMLKQYMQIKSQRPGLLLLWKSGDFYQAFFEDAKKVSEVCNVALSAIKGGELLDGLVPMASLHLKEVDLYIQALLEKGVSVLKQDQLHRVAHDTSSQVHLSTILTPGTAKINRMLHDSSIVALVPSCTKDGTWGLAYADISTGKIIATEGQGQNSLVEEIVALCPSEIIYSADTNAEPTHLPPGLPGGFCYSSRPSSQFCPTFLKKKLQDIFEVDSLDHFGLGTLSVAACAVGGLLGYIEDIQCSSGAKLLFHNIASYSPLEFMLLDQHTRSCLEVFKTRRQGQLEGSLLWAMDSTKTPMGKRLLKRWLLRPLLDKELICTRLDAVEVLVNDSILREQLRQDLSLINDIERLAMDIVSSQSSSWDLLAMGQSLNVFCTLRAKLEDEHNPYFTALENDKALLDLVQKIQTTFEMEASSILQNGQTVKDNVDPTLDRLRNEIHSLDVDVKDLENLERDRTKISSLEIVRNKKGDYLISVKKGALVDMRIPDDFQLYASEASEHAEWFVTASLLEHNKKRSEVITKARLQEAEILESLRGQVLHNLKAIQAASQAIAAIDVLATFAEMSAARDYCKPVILEGSREITITGGRHPVAELLKSDRKQFKANSLYMGYQSNGDQKNRHRSALYSDLNELSGFLPEECWPRPDVLILTGPPASGKSCYMCQAGIIQLLAQVGSYVPAEEAILGITDAIFMKMGDCDDVSTGQSSFELNMQRCAHIFKNATSQSMIFLDGVARVASPTDDGAITRAIVEFLAQNVKARTLLTTQNSCLGSLEDEYPNIASFQCMNDADLRLMYCVKPGFSFESPVAALHKIEGFPECISSRAGQLISKDDITGEEAFELDRQLHGDDLVDKDSLQLKQDSHYCETTEEEQLQLEDDPTADGSLSLAVDLPADATKGEDSLELGQQFPEKSSGSRVLSSEMRPENLNILSGEEKEIDAINANPTLSSEGSSEITPPRSEGDAVQQLVDLEALKSTWQEVLLVLESYPATCALAKQKGTLVSIQKSVAASQVHITTSALFLKKFLQHEHATALEKAFSTVLQSPVQLKLTVAAERKA